MVHALLDVIVQSRCYPSDTYLVGSKAIRLVKVRIQGRDVLSTISELNLRLLWPASSSTAPMGRLCSPRGFP